MLPSSIDNADAEDVEGYDGAIVDSAFDDEMLFIEIEAEEIANVDEEDVAPLDHAFDSEDAVPVEDTARDEGDAESEIVLARADKEEDCEAEELASVGNSLDCDSEDTGLDPCKLTELEELGDIEFEVDEVAALAEMLRLASLAGGADSACVIDDDAKLLVELVDMAGVADVWDAL